MAYSDARYRAAIRRARRARSRYGSSAPGWQKVGIAVVAVAVLSGAAGKVVAHHRHHGGQPAAIPAGDLSTRVAWARAFLRAIPEPRTQCNLNAVTEWE